MDFRNDKLAIAIPSCRDWKVGFGCSLLGLAKRLFVAGINFEINAMQGASLLPKARHLAIEWAKSVKATHLLFLDDDMAFQEGAVEPLLKSDKDFIGCNYATKMTCDAVARSFLGGPVTSDGKFWVEEVKSVGLGVFLLKLEALNKIEFPLFETIWKDNNYIGEDVFFCEKIRSHGHKIYIDHSASQKVAHIGDAFYVLPSQKNQTVRQINMPSAGEA